MYSSSIMYVLQFGNKLEVFFTPLPPTRVFFLAISRTALILLSNLRVKHFALYIFGSVAMRDSAGVLPSPATEIVLIAHFVCVYSP